MPRDISGDSLAALRIVEQEEDESSSDDSPISCDSTQKLRRASTRSQPPIAQDGACYYNYAVNEPIFGSKQKDKLVLSLVSAKTNSLPANSCLKQCWDEVICSALRVSPEDLASQLTLLDLPCFKAIQADELTDCAWNKKNKLTAAPNVVAFTRRFNQVSFWTVQEILNESSSKSRAEVLAHFIKVARKLHELNNIHSLFAIISALQSASIFRLSKTWMCLAKKEKLSFDRLAELFNDKDNWSALREYIQSLKLPCIPYLGIFLTDLVYIDMAHAAGSTNRKAKMATILESLATYQRSDYCHLRPIPLVQEFLNNVRYIEELQKFLEDDQYKLSLKLEPPSPVGSSIGSKESVKAWEHCSTHGKTSPFSLSPSHKPITGSLRLPAATVQGKFLLGHRKCRSLGNNLPDFSPGMETSLNLLDDTLLESPIASIQSPLGYATLDQRKMSVDRLLPYDMSAGFQGHIRRKTVLKYGRKPSVSSWQRYWLQIWASSLVYFSPKTFKGTSTTERSNFKREPCKMVSLEGWIVLWVEGKSSNVFELVNHQTACVYKFKTASLDNAKDWVTNIRAIIEQPVKPLPANLMSFE